VTRGDHEHEENAAERAGIIERWRLLSQETGQAVAEIAAEELLRTRQSLRVHRAAMRAAGLDIQGAV
jgi:protein-disulfide isomerase-like protein with CxxC motif